jgi:hypothetical protein
LAIRSFRLDRIARVQYPAANPTMIKPGKIYSKDMQNLASMSAPRIGTPPSCRLGEADGERDAGLREAQGIEGAARIATDPQWKLSRECGFRQAHRKTARSDVSSGSDGRAAGSRNLFLSERFESPLDAQRRRIRFSRISSASFARSTTARNHLAHEVSAAEAGNEDDQIAHPGKLPAGRAVPKELPEGGPISPNDPQANATPSGSRSANQPLPRPR